MVQEGVSLREALVKVVLMIMMMRMIMLDDYERYLIFEGEVKTRCETERWIPPTADRMGKTLPGRH